MIIGVDIGGTSIKVGLVKEDGTIVKKESYKVVNGNQEKMAEELGRFILKFMDNDLYNVLGIGLACPGIIDRKNGICQTSPNLFWHDLHICEIIKDICHKDVQIINDANAAALAELVLGAGVGYKSFVMLTLGTGVGGGIVINHELFEGEDDSETELGHWTLIENGEPCNCGKKGCVEAYCSATALIRDTKIAMEQNRDSMMWDFADMIVKANGQTAFETAKLGDKAATEVVNNYVKYLSDSIIMFNNIYHPEVFLLGGGVSLQKEHLTHKVEDKIYEISQERIHIIPSKLNNDSGIVGAACLFLK